MESVIGIIVVILLALLGQRLVARLNNTHHKQTPLPDWPSDWLYRLIFQEVERAWAMCERKRHSKYLQYVLIGEWSDAKDSFCRGKLLRLWIRDAEGLKEIPTQSLKEHKRKIKDRIYPFILVSFHIHPDRTRVVYCHREADTAGSGTLPGDWRP